MTAYFDAMRNYGAFAGRATRSQFWLYTLVLAVLLIICAIVDVALGFGDGKVLPLTGLCNLVHLIPTWAISVRRLHDTDRTGGWLLLSAVPVIGQVVLFVFMCQASTAGVNEFGYPSTAQTGQAPQGAAVADLGASSTTTIERIERLAALRASGTIDDAEFQRLKAEVMQPGTR